MKHIINSLETFCKNSVLSIPIICFMIGIIDFKYILITIGIILCGIINFIIKSIINKILPYKYTKRPNNAKGCGACNDNYIDNIGLPSGHSQLAWFFVFYLWLLKPNIRNALILFPIALIISISRYFSNCHTKLQIFIGSLIGIIFAYYFREFIILFF